MVQKEEKANDQIGVYSFVCLILISSRIGEVFNGVKVGEGKELSRGGYQITGTQSNWFRRRHLRQILRHYRINWPSA